MNFQEVLRKRRTIRDFSDNKLGMDQVREAIDDAFLAPTYNHLKQWYFIIVDDYDKKVELTKTEEMYDRVSDEIRSSFKNHDPVAKEMYLDAIPKQKKMILEAPIVIVATYIPKTKISDVKRVYDLNGFASIWCAIENLLLSLAEKNIFGVTFIPKNTSHVKNVLNIPDGIEIASIIPIGFKKEGAKAITPKKIKIEEHIKINHWDDTTQN